MQTSGPGTDPGRSSVAWWRGASDDVAVPPGEVLERARIDPAHVTVLDGRIPNWRVVVGDQPAGLKRDWHHDVADIAWEHAFLSRLARTGFPAPRPITAFAGQSWLLASNALWTLVSFQPGHTLGWEHRPDLGDVGRFIARFHAAVEGLEWDAPRPLVPTIDKLAALAPWEQLERSLQGRDGVRQFGAYLEQTAAELASIEHARPAGVHPWRFHHRQCPH